MTHIDNLTFDEWRNQAHGHDNTGLAVGWVEYLEAQHNRAYQQFYRDAYQVGNVIMYDEFARIAREMDENGEWDEDFVPEGDDDYTVYPPLHGDGA